MSDRTPEQHAETVRAALHHIGPTQQWLDAVQALEALARLAADTERLRETGGLAAIAARILAGHNDTCDHALNNEYVCSCGHDLLVAAFGDALAPPPADTEPRCVRCGKPMDRLGVEIDVSTCDKCAGPPWGASPPADTEQP